MSQTTLLTREPVVNKNRAITANRLIAHGPNVAAVVETLNALGDVWPTHHPVFVSLGLGAILVVLSAVAAALTLLPAVLSKVHPKFHQEHVSISR